MNSEIKVLREQKSKLNKHNPKDKKELKHIRRRMFEIARVRSKLPVDLKWSGEEIKRRQEATPTDKQKR